MRSMNSFSVSASYPSFATSCLMCGTAPIARRFDQDKGDRVAHRRDVLHRPAEGGVERRDSEQPAGRDLGDADDDAAVVVDLEFGPDGRVLELGELLVGDDDEAIFGVDVLDAPFDQLRTSEQARVVEARGP